MDIFLRSLMDGNVLLKVVALQLVIAAAIVLFLKRTLERELMDAVVEKIASIPHEKALAVREVVVVTAAGLRGDGALRLSALIRDKFPQAKILEGTDRSLWGGVVVRADADVFDGCLATRITHLFRPKGA